MRRKCTIERRSKDSEDNGIETFSAGLVHLPDALKKLEETAGVPRRNHSQEPQSALTLAQSSPPSVRAAALNTEDYANMRVRLAHRVETSARVSDAPLAAKVWALKLLEFKACPACIQQCRSSG